MRRKIAMVIVVIIISNIAYTDSTEAGWWSEILLLTYMERSPDLLGYRENIKDNLMDHCLWLAVDGPSDRWYYTGSYGSRGWEMGGFVQSNPKDSYRTIDNFESDYYPEDDRFGMNKNHGIDDLIYMLNHYLPEENNAVTCVAICATRELEGKNYSLGNLLYKIKQMNIKVAIITDGINEKAMNQYKYITENTGGIILDINSDYGATLANFHYSHQTPPSLTIQSPEENTYYSNNTAVIPKIVVSDYNNEDLTCRYTIDSTNNWSETKQVTNSQNAQTVAFDALSLENLSDGWHNIYFEVRDSSTVTSGTRRICIDRTDPNINQVNIVKGDTSITTTVLASDQASGLALMPYRHSIGRTSGSWVSNSSNNYTGLKPNTAYEIKTEVKDKVGNIKVKEQEVRTLAQIPTVNNYTSKTNEIELILLDQNPVDTYYQVYCNGQYLNNVGNLDTTESWVITPDKKFLLKGLASNTTYNIQIKAKNENGEKTAFSQVAQVTTLPDSPTGLMGTASQTFIDLSFNSIPGVQHYELEIDGSQVVTVYQSPYRHVGIGVDTEHSYRLRAVNGGGRGAYGSLVTVKSLPYPPEMPLEMTTEVNPEEVIVSWKPVIGADYYELKVNGVTEEVRGTNRYVHSGIQPETTHNYQVRAVNRGGMSEWTQLIEVTTLPYPPEKIENITTEKTNTSITLNFEAVEDADSYELEIDGNLLSLGDKTSYNHVNLGAMTTHKYRVRGVNVGGKGPWSEYEIVQTNPNKPNRPTSVFGTSTKNSISVLYNKVDYADLYEIEIDGNRIVENTLTAFDHLDLSEGEAHTYRVRASNITGKSEWSESFRISTLSTPADEKEAFALTNIGAIVTNRSITISWESIDYDVTYKVEADGVMYDLGSDEIYQHSNLDASTLHEYKIMAVRQGEKAFECGALSLYTLPNPPDAPKNLEALPEQNAMKLTWSKSENADAYELEVDGTAVMVGDSDNYIDEHLHSGSSHTYRIRALNITGVTAWSDPVTMSTINPETELEIKSGNYYDMSVVLQNVQDFTGKRYEIEYDESKLQLEDVCIYTKEKEVSNFTLTSMQMAIEVEEGKIIMKPSYPIVPGTSFDGEINGIRFKALVDGTTTLKLTEVIDDDK